ncbi:MAG: PD-(D/E)XK nuclease family protein [Chthonomonas sp.]|nr:PD-(D/E)XK nuclease family protein [Chthonomonas sp.]
MTELEVLTQFAADNANLQELEEQLFDFNVFEAAGLTRQEIRHSRFLAYLLNPRAAHGLGDTFLSNMLGMVLTDEDDLRLHEAHVECEVHNIDILILCERNRLAVVIENKVGSGEHSDQLARYLKVVEDNRPGWKVVPILLSPWGMKPSDVRYHALAYESVAGILVEVLADEKALLKPDVRVAIQHYERLLRRNVVKDTRVSELCQQILKKHRRAIEILIDHMEDPRQRLWRITDQLFEERGFVRTGKRWLPEEWLMWVPTTDESVTGYVFGFWIDVYKGPVRLVLSLHPSAPEVEQRLLEVVAVESDLFRSFRKGPGRDMQILAIDLSPTLEPFGEEELWLKGIQDRFRHFVTSSLPQVAKVLKGDPP